MKKIIVCISILTVILSMFVACGDKPDDSESTTTSTTAHSVSTIDPNYSMTKPQYTVGSPKTSEKFGSDSRAYVIAHYDENGYVAKEDVYENGKMVYYYIVTGTDETGNAILVSIHQNMFSDSRYHGAQVFYGPEGESKDLAEQLQVALCQFLNPGSNRKIKKADGIYLMQHIKCMGVLVECGFLSNPEEEAMLRTKEYQQKLSCVIAGTLSQFLTDEARADII